jgi:hypothetical protein
METNAQRRQTSLIAPSPQRTEAPDAQLGRASDLALIEERAATAFLGLLGAHQVFDFLADGGDA